MWRLETLRADISRPLAAAVDEILALFEKTISEYEEKVSRLQEENNEQRELLDAARSPRVVLHRAAFPPELQQLSVCKEDLPPEQQERSPSLGQEEPEPPHVKAEEEEFSVKGEHDAQWSQLHQPQTEENSEAEPLASTSTEQMEAEVDPEDPAAALEPSGAEQLLSSHCSEPEPETDDSDGGWKETRQPQSGYHRKPHSTHGGKKRYPCGQCGKRFSQSAKLKIHQRTHTGDELYRCDQCGKRFKQANNLKSHQRTHTGEKPYPCEQCGKRFSRLNNLKTHLRFHTGMRPYDCEQCGKSFTTRGNLKGHQRTHTGEKPYPCEKCEKRFGRLQDFKMHQYTHTGEKPHHCDHCGKRFGRLQSLKRHRRTHAGEKNLTPVNSVGKDLVASISEHISDFTLE